MGPGGPSPTESSAIMFFPTIALVYSECTRGSVPSIPSCSKCPGVSIGSAKIRRRRADEESRVGYMR